MSYTILAYDDSQTSGLSRFLVDNVSDITTLPIDCKAGSKVTVANTGAEYMLNNQNEWKLQTAGSGSGGGGTWSGAAWGDIAGSIEDQIDLQNALDKKQNILVSGTNIKTVNGNSLIGSGNITISEEDPVARANIKVIANVTHTVGTNSETGEEINDISCDKTFNELLTAINNTGVNIPVIIYKLFSADGMTLPPPSQYLYLTRISHAPVTPGRADIYLRFSDISQSGVYISIGNDDSIKVTSFSQDAHIRKGIITYNSETQTYACDKTFGDLYDPAAYDKCYSFVTYQGKLYSLLNYEEEMSEYGYKNIISITFGHLNTATNKIELFTITRTAIAYDEVALGGGTETITRREMTSSDTNVTLASNTFYTFPTMTTLTVTAPSTGLCMLRFGSGRTPTTFTINNVTMPNSFSVEKNKVYEINIYEGYGTVTSWNYDIAE